MKKDYLLLILSLSVGLVASILLAPKNKYFFGNFIYFWGPQCIVFLAVTILRFKIGILTGTAFVFGVYLFAFHSWVFSHSRPESLLWLIYLFSFIGGGLGALLAGIIGKINASMTNLHSMMLSSVFSIIGLVVSLLVMNIILV